MILQQLAEISALISFEEDVLHGRKELDLNVKVKRRHGWVIHFRVLGSFSD